jgi:hypothetical protein
VAPGAVRIVLTRRGAAEQVQSYTLRAGDSATVRPGQWTPVGGLDLSGLLADAVCSIGGERLAAGAALHPGDYVLHVARPGCVAQNLPVTVVPAAVTPVAAQPWVRVERAARLLADIADWDAASGAERRAAADHADRLDPAMTLRELRSFRSGTASHEVAIFVHTATGLEFALCPGGRFTTGSPATEPGRAADETMSDVSVPPFLIARTELPAHAWRNAANESPRAGAALGLPAAGVSWIEADAWCREQGLALPTASQWEFACRAGTKTAYSFGDDGRALVRYGQARGAGALEVDSGLGRIGGRQPNAFGLHDMHGNVWEWCAAEEDEAVRVARGGSFRNRAQEARSASRCRLPPQSALDTVGFRPVRHLRLE